MTMDYAIARDAGLEPCLKLQMHTSAECSASSMYVAWTGVGREAFKPLSPKQDMESGLQAKSGHRCLHSQGCSLTRLLPYHGGPLQTKSISSGD